jgi:AraC-like DNA-binding protein
MVAAAGFRPPFVGREKLEPAVSIPRHRHEHGYVAVILSGSYEEAGFGGRFHLKAGDVVIHRPFDAHLDHVSRAGAEVLNLPLPRDIDLPDVFTVTDPDALARLAEHDPKVAAGMLTPTGPVKSANDWPDRLAAAASSTQALGSWAEAQGLAAETLSRGFRKAYGITPARFRAEMKVQKALGLIVESSLALAEIAMECGFADQPHFTRAVFGLTGRTPGSWRRRSIPFKTDSIKPD